MKCINPFSISKYYYKFNFFWRQSLLQEESTQSIIIMQVLCLLVLTHHFTTEVENVEFFQTLASQPATKLFYHEKSITQISAHWRGVNTIFPNFQRVIYGYVNVHRCSAHLSHIDACSDVPLRMPVTQLCHSSYWIESCILCKCGGDHL